MTPIQAACAVLAGTRPKIPSHVPEYITRIIRGCWNGDQLRRPSFAYISLGMEEYKRAASKKANEMY